MKYPDTIRLATVKPDMYGDNSVTSLTEIPASFIRRSGFTHGENTEGETSDAAVYLLPTNPMVLELEEDLEGMYLQAPPFSSKSWYRISTATYARRKLLNNALDNVYCRLDKVAGIANVHIS